MSSCYSPCMSMPATSACPNMLDMSCVCQNMEAFNSMTCCIQEKCSTGAMLTAAWGLLEDMCSAYGTATSALTCNTNMIAGGASYGSGSSGSTPTTSKKITYTAAPGVYASGGYGWPNGYSGTPGVVTSASASARPAGYGKTTSDAAPRQPVKAFGVASLLSLGLGASLIVGLVMQV